MTEPPVPGFADVLRQLRAEARLTQEELAEAAGLSPRTVSDLERGVNRTAHKDTAGLLADARGKADPVRGVFVAAARGRVPAAEVLAARAEALEARAEILALHEDSEAAAPCGHDRDSGDRPAFHPQSLRTHTCTDAVTSARASSRR